MCVIFRCHHNQLAIEVNRASSYSQTTHLSCSAQHHHPKSRISSKCYHQFGTRVTCSRNLVAKPVNVTGPVNQLFFLAGVLRSANNCSLLDMFDMLLIRIPLDEQIVKLHCSPSPNLNLKLITRRILLFLGIYYYTHSPSCGGM